MGEPREILGYDDTGAPIVGSVRYYSDRNHRGLKQKSLRLRNALIERRLAKLRVKGPINGKLYVCYDWRKPGRCATAMTPEGALNAWRSYWSLIP